MTILDKLNEYLDDATQNVPVDPSGDDLDDLDDMMIGLIRSLDSDKLTDSQVAARNDIIAELEAKQI